MIKQLTTFGAALAMGAATLIPATPAMAQRGYYNDGYYQQSGDRYYRGDRYDRYDRGDRYYRGDRYRGQRYRDARNYRGYDCGRRNSGTTGTIIGAIAGGLLGHEVVGRRGDRTAGAIVGAGVGALAGRAIDKSSGNRRC